MRNSIVLLALLTAGIIIFSGCTSTNDSNGNNTKTLPNASSTTHSGVPKTEQATTLLQDTITTHAGETTTTKASSRTTTTRAGAKTIEVDIKSFAFDPKTIAITKGDTVVWTNMDAAPHRVISDIGSVKTELDSQTLAKGDSYSHTFSELGTYAYHCSIHTSMKGEIIVD
jgi:plastocyanin